VSRAGRTLAPLAFLSAGTLYPLLFSGDYMVHLGVLVCLYVVLTSSLNLIVGYTGQFAVAHASFYGIGAYGSVLLVTRAGFPYWLACVLAVVVAALCAWVIGASTLHLKGAYLAICTFAFSELFRLMLDNWVSLTNGANGIIVRLVPGIGIPGFFSWNVDSRMRFYYVFWLLAAGTVGLIARLVASDAGRVLKAIRQDELLALAAGFPTGRYKIFAFVLGSALAAIAGAVYAPYISFIAPELFDVNETVYVMMIMMIGGIRTIWGPVWGSIVLVSLPQILEIKPFVRMIVYGVVLIVIIVRLPGGLSQLAGMVARRALKREPRSDRRERPSGGTTTPASSAGGSVVESNDA
jgi:branched-chain amino acid transport system permease protein